VYGIRIEVAGISLYHQGSANLDDGQLAHAPVDVFLAGVAGRSVTPRYWERILPRLDPRVIVPTHYDDFFKPLGEPEGFSVILRQFLAERLWSGDTAQARGQRAHVGHVYDAGWVKNTIMAYQAGCEESRR